MKLTWRKVWMGYLAVLALSAFGAVALVGALLRPFMVKRARQFLAEEGQEHSADVIVLQHPEAP